MGLYSFNLFGPEWKSEMINELIQAGANVNAQDKKGWTALMWVAHWGPSKSKAILYKQISEASILIKAKANVNAIGKKVKQLYH